MKSTKTIIKRFLKKIFFFGYNYYCPNCNSNLRNFIFCGTDSPIIKEKQIIAAGRRKKECPVCHSAERDRLVFLFVKDYLKAFDNENKINILHIAPEDCLFPLFKKNINHTNYICGDKFEEGYSYSLNVLYMDITAIDYEDNYFDLIICNHVLEHIADDLTAMKELYRVLKPNGKAILQVPVSCNMEKTFEDFTITDPSEREKIFGQKNHCRIYGKDYGKRLETAGFKFTPVFISDRRYKKYGLDEREQLFLAVKS